MVILSVQVARTPQEDRTESPAFYGRVSRHETETSVGLGESGILYGHTASEVVEQALELGATHLHVGEFLVRPGRLGLAEVAEAYLNG